MTKLILGALDKGLRTDVTAFNIENESFAKLVNAYQWRSRIKRKRGTSLLGRLQRLFPVKSIGTTGVSPWTFNLFSFLTPNIPSISEPNPIIVLGSVEVFISPSVSTNNILGYTIASDCEVETASTAGLTTGDQVFITGVVSTAPNLINGGPYIIEVINATHFKLGVDSHSWGSWVSGGTWTSTNTGAFEFIDQGNGTLETNPVDPNNFGTINYVTGNITLTHTAGSGVATSATFSYYPNLPVMGLEDLELIPTQFPGTLAFDTKYSYDISTANPYPITDVTFYKNPIASASLPGYTAKTTLTPFTWNGKNYQQFWSVNSQGSLFVTNGITIPFTTTNIGMQYLKSSEITSATQVTATTVDFVIPVTPLVVGDFVFANEFTGLGGSSINFQTGYVITVVGTTYTVKFPDAVIVAGLTPGILQYLTNTSDATRDPIRFYDGRPQDGGLGWVNFSPPLSQSEFSVAGLPLAQYYLVGARIIADFKDRLLFLGCVVENSAGGIFYLPDTIIYSQNGTPYYTASFSGAVDSSATVFNPLLVPINQVATAPAWFEDDTGFGGFISAGISQPLTTVSSNEDVLILGFSTTKARLVYQGNDLVPFLFYFINSELGDASTFSIIDMDKGVISRGTRGYIICSQNQAQRIDLAIPDQVFQIDLSDNGNERFTATRNFIQEWIYFTYCSNNNAEGISNTAVFPNQSLFYNYRDNSWSIFNESYTTYGQFRKQTGFTWSTIGFTDYKTWEEWNDAWNAGTSTLLQELTIAGNQQGFVIVKDVGTSECTSLYISSFSNGTNIVTSPDHNLNNNDYIIISGALGTVGPLVNGKMFQVFGVTRDTFRLKNDPLITTETYLGGGLMTVAYVPFIQTKQFPMAWDMARKTRIGVQQYLFTKTYNAQVTLQIYLSQDADNPYNIPPIPAITDSNDAIVYSQVVYTCPESTNLGLTPANINLNTPTAGQQAQIWHRMNTSLIGDTVQLGITLSDAQMRDLEVGNAFAEIEFHGAILELSPSQMLC